MTHSTQNILAAHSERATQLTTLRGELLSELKPWIEWGLAGYRLSGRDPVRIKEKVLAAADLLVAKEVDERLGMAAFVFKGRLQECVRSFITKAFAEFGI